MIITKQCDCWLCKEGIRYNGIRMHLESTNTPHYGLEADLIMEEMGLKLCYQDEI